ncbi:MULTISPECIES: CobD/CbiB family cobalamin biosynthesis protein [unclassified Desulfovibrio]|uniref:CobD/CbiB family cobalamin biosynthesis protein n=1 Tax=unclassified Desulfovibrio TaxID=2593640 RepID=UPI001F155F9C|nr:MULTISPECIES: CobD/CbiB family cobalamin biosynthesis protein [unclassified Desulfovibrio]
MSGFFPAWAVLPWSAWECWWLAPCALALDLMFGDPALPWPHPVCLVGKCLSRLEGPARRFGGAGPRAPLRLLLAGAMALLLLCAGTGAAVWLLVSLPAAGGLLALYLAWAGLAMGSLVSIGREVAEAVEEAPLPEARAALSRLVSRDVSALERLMLRKTLADTLSENFTDAFLAPWFWLLVGGPVGLWVYKAVSTGDSMWGYLNTRWRWLGWAPARADDALAFVPARLSVLALRLADAAARPIPSRRAWRGSWPGLSVVARQAKGMPSPNSGWSMTACAWLCAGRMAGPSVYFGELVVKPWLGPPERDAAPWDAARIRALIALEQWGAVCGALALWLACLGMRLLF